MATLAVVPELIQIPVVMVISYAYELLEVTASCLAGTR